MKRWNNAVAMIGAVIALSAFWAGPPAQAQTWPHKPIRMIMPLAAGGTTDAAARVIAAQLTDALGQSVLIDNKPGANGVLGVQQASKAPPDGYTFVVGSSTTMAANNFLYKSTGFEPLKDFTAVAMIGTLNFVFVVPADSRYKTMKDLLNDAKLNPQKVTFGYGSSGSLLCYEALHSATGIEMLKVPYQSTPNAITDLAGGRVDLMCDGLGTTTSLVKAGKLRFLAVTGQQRDSLVPDVPTMQEAGTPMTHQTWAGIFALARTPQPIVERMSSEIQKILSKSDVQQKIRDQGFVPSNMGYAEFRKVHEAEYKRLAELVKQSGITPE